MALMIQAWSSTLNQNSIKCAKRQVSLFLIFILKLLLCGNNFLLQILHWCVLRTLSSLSNIGIAVNLCISWWVYVRILSLLGLLCLAGLLLLLLMLQSRSSFLRRTIGLLITSSSNHVLATPSPQPLIVAFIAPPRINSGHPNSQFSKGTRCEFCHTKSHDITVCRKL